MSTKTKIMIGVIVIGMLGLVAVMNGFIGHNDDQDWKVLQYLGGTVGVRTTPGFFIKRFASEWVYPKIRRRYFSADEREGGYADESIKVIFKDKGTADFSTMILYSTPYLDAGDAIYDDDTRGLREGKLARFHRLTRGDIDVCDKMILARIKEIARIASEGITASECVEKQSTFITNIRSAAMQDVTIRSYGVVIDEVALSDIVFDKETLKQFKKQQEAILLAKEAEANKIKFDMKTLETKAEYEQKIAETKGMADMEKMQMVTNAQRDKELAEINAQKKVEVAIRAKKEQETIASAKLSVATIAKNEELMIASMKLEVAEIGVKEAIAKKKSVIALAEGKEKAIKLSGAITELEQAMIDAEVEKARVVSSALAKIHVPGVLMISNGDDGTGNSKNIIMENLINLRLMEATGMLDKINVNKTSVKRRPIQKQSKK